MKNLEFFTNFRTKVLIELKFFPSYTIFFETTIFKIAWKIVKTFECFQKNYLFNVYFSFSNNFPALLSCKIIFF